MESNRIYDLWNNLRKYQKEINPEKYKAMELASLATNTSFEKIERYLNVTLPEEFKISYMINNTSSEKKIFGNNGFLYSIEEIFSWAKENSSNFLDTDYDKSWENTEDASLINVISEKIVAPNVVWPKQWLHFGDVFGEVFLILDLREEMKRDKGCVILFDTSVYELAYGYPSYEACLEDAINQVLETGTFENLPIDF